MVMRKLLSILLLVFGSISLKSQSQETLASLLKQRDIFIEKNQSTREIDYKLIKGYSYSPKAVASKKSTHIFSFDTYLPMKESGIEQFKQRLLNSFKIKNVEIDSKKRIAEVEFNSTAEEIDRINFFKAFGYDGIIYK